MNEGSAMDERFSLDPGPAANAMEATASELPPASALARWNALPQEEAIDAILPCCGSRAWARALAQQRPFAVESALCSASDTVWLGLKPADWQQAFDSHPRIGERHAQSATAQSLIWSAQEQNATELDDAAVQRELALGNVRYEQRFGRIFLIRAAGRSAREMLVGLQTRLQNDDETELLEAVEQQRQITQLRLHRWLSEPVGSSKHTHAAGRKEG